MNRWFALSIATGLVAGAATLPAQEGGRGHGEETFNTRLVGTDDLQGRSAYQPLPVRQGARRILYVGHHAGEALNPLTGAVETHGTSVVDVTVPETPVYLAHIPASGGAGGSQMVQVCAGDRLPRGQSGRFYLLRPNGNRSQEIWDVTDPAGPAFVRTVAEMGRTPAGEASWAPATEIATVPDGWQVRMALPGIDPGAVKIDLKGGTARSGKPLRNTRVASEPPPFPPSDLSGAGEVVELVHDALVTEIDPSVAVEVRERGVLSPHSKGYRFRVHTARELPHPRQPQGRRGTRLIVHAQIQ